MLDAVLPTLRQGQQSKANLTEAFMVLFVDSVLSDKNPKEILADVTVDGSVTMPPIDYRPTLHTTW